MSYPQKLEFVDRVTRKGLALLAGAMIAAGSVDAMAGERYLQLDHDTYVNAATNEVLHRNGEFLVDGSGVIQYRLDDARHGASLGRTNDQNYATIEHDTQRYGPDGLGKEVEPADEKSYDSVPKEPERKSYKSEPKRKLSGPVAEGQYLPANPTMSDVKVMLDRYGTDIDKSFEMILEAENKLPDCELFHMVKGDYFARNKQFDESLYEYSLVLKEFNPYNRTAKLWVDHLEK